jgi:hypothetical protein
MTVVPRASSETQIVIQLLLCWLFHCRPACGNSAVHAYHEPPVSARNVWGWFDTLTFILWPGAFYLTLLQSEEPAKVAFVVWSIAVLFNPVIYAAVGWLVWQLGRVVKRIGQG